MIKIRGGVGRKVPAGTRSGAGCDGDWFAAIWMDQRMISSERAPESKLKSPEKYLTFSSHGYIEWEGENKK